MDDDATKPQDELLDARPEPRHSRWWAAVGVAVVAAAVVYVVGQDSDGGSPVPASSSTSVAARPVIPDYSTLPAKRVPMVDITPSVELCPAECERSTTSFHATSAIRARLATTFGDVSALRIATYVTRAVDANGRRALYSRVVQARVPAGELKVVVTQSPDGRTPDLSLPERPGTSQVAVVGTVIGAAAPNYTTRTVLRFGPAVPVPRAVTLTHRISEDAALVISA